MAGLDFLYSPNSQVYEAGQRMQQDDLMNTGKDLQNQQMQAQLPGIIGNSQSLAAKGTTDQSMMSDRMQAEHTRLMSGMSDDQAKLLDNFGNSVGQMGSMLEQVPPVLRGQAMQQMSQKFGIQDQLPDLSQVPQEQLPQVLRTMGEQMSLSGRKFLQEKALKDQDNQAHMARQVQSGKDALATTQVKADTTLEKTSQDNQAKQERLVQELATRVQVAEQRTAAAEAKVGMAQQFVRLNGLVSSGQATDEQKDEFRRLAQMMNTQKVLGTPQTADAVLGQSTPIERANQATDSITGLGGITGSGNQVSKDPNQQTISQAFGSYEPNKYQYRVIDGKVQRRPK